MTNTAFIGEVNPAFVEQNTEFGCFGACLEVAAAAQGINNLSQDVFLERLDQVNLYASDAGVHLAPAEMFDLALSGLGVNVRGVYAARNEANSTLESPEVQARFDAIDDSLENNESVILMFLKELVDHPEIPKGKRDFAHFVTITGSEQVGDEKIYTVVDSGTLEGGVFHFGHEDLLKYVAPSWGYPVMAFGVSASESRQPLERPILPDNEDAGDRLLTHPLWREEETGIPIPPDSRDAVSVTMPTFELVEQWTTLGNAVLSQNGDGLPYAYPRFGLHPDIQRASFEIMGEFGWFPYPTREAAQQSGYLAGNHPEGNPLKAQIVERGGAFWLADSGFNEKSWQHLGLGISSRHARALREGRPENDIQARDRAEDGIKALIEQYTDADKEDIYLFGTGMAAIHKIAQVMRRRREAASIQFSFPYTDTYAEQLYFGGNLKNVRKNVHDVRDGDYEKLQQLADSGQDFSYLMTELSSNPLLSVPDLELLGSILGDTDIVLDDTVGSMYNIDDKKLPPNVAARVMSLTKYISGRGNVTGGAVVLRKDNPHYAEIKALLDEAYVDDLWYEDAVVLHKNSKDYEKIMPKINSNADELATWLDDEYAGEDGPLEKVFYPSLTNKETFDAIKVDGAGRGGLMTLQFKDREQAKHFLRNLKLTKGPSLGTKYTIVCPYTLLAHKDELDTVRGFGMEDHLIRISVGIEELAQLKEAVSEALRS